MTGGRGDGCEWGKTPEEKVRLEVITTGLKRIEELAAVGDDVPVGADVDAPYARATRASQRARRGRDAEPKTLFPAKESGEREQTNDCRRSVTRRSRPCPTPSA